MRPDELLTFSVLDWVMLALAATLVGVSKTALPGVATVPVALFAAVLPAKESTGALLVLLLVGDVTAVCAYRAFTDWAALRRLIPSVVGGVVGGTGLLVVAGDEVIRRVIGGMLVLLVVVNVVLLVRAVPAADDEHAPARLVSVTYGFLGGFTTMVANAGGPVMSMYFLASRFSVSAFLGTAAWFFFVVNAIKLPFSLGLGLITRESLVMNLWLVPAVLVGAWMGRTWARRISQSWFNMAVMVLTLASGAYLLVLS